MPIPQLIKGLHTNENIKLDRHVRLTEYRGVNEGEQVVENLFIADIEVFRSQIRRLKASGGGSEAASTLDTIFNALHSDWHKEIT
jgi:hypothetical protein